MEYREVQFEHSVIRYHDPSLTETIKWWCWDDDENDEAKTLIEKIRTEAGDVAVRGALEDLFAVPMIKWNEKTGGLSLLFVLKDHTQIEVDIVETILRDNRDPEESVDLATVLRRLANQVENE